MKRINTAELRWRAQLVGWGVLVALGIWLWHGSGKSSPSAQSLPDSVVTALGHVVLPARCPDTLLHYPGFDVHFNPSTHIANYVVYRLGAEQAAVVAERKGSFYTDTAVAGCARNADYAASGYDRGHLVPAGDLCHSEEAMRNSFALTNIAPQSSRLNEGGWARLEDLVRCWAQRDTALLVIAGPVVGCDAPRIGVTGVAVPRAFFKIVVAYRVSPCRAVAFLYPNAESDLPLANYAVTIDSVERLMGMRFLTALPPDLARTLKHTINLARWQE